MTKVFRYIAKQKDEFVKKKTGGSIIDTYYLGFLWSVTSHTYCVVLRVIWNIEQLPW